MATSCIRKPTSSSPTNCSATSPASISRKACAGPGSGIFRSSRPHNSGWLVRSSEACQWVHRRLTCGTSFSRECISPAVIVSGRPRVFKVLIRSTALVTPGDGLCVAGKVVRSTDSAAACRTKPPFDVIRRSAVWTMGEPAAHGALRQRCEDGAWLESRSDQREQSDHEPRGDERQNQPHAVASHGPHLP